MAAAEHGADFPLARKLRRSMTHEQLHDFASGSMKGKPEHVGKPRTPRTGARKIEVETHAYDWRQRSGLKRG